MSTHATLDDCGGSSCQCATGTVAMAGSAPRINGISLSVPGAEVDAAAWRELAHTELLRQQAVNAGLLPRYTGLSAPELTDADRQVIEDMVDAAVLTVQATEEECQRYFKAHKAQFVVGQALHVRHILFAVTEGVNVLALAAHAEQALLSLLGKEVSSERFGQLAADLSNCPSGAQGGDLGWIGPGDCAPELARELFHPPHAQLGLGVHPRLVQTRFGFHIIELLGRRKGQQKAYAQVSERIAAQLALQSRAKALHQYMSLLVGRSLVEGLDLEAADSPLVQ